MENSRNLLKLAEAHGGKPVKFGHGFMIKQTYEVSSDTGLQGPI